MNQTLSRQSWREYFSRLFSPAKQRDQDTHKALSQGLNPQMKAWSDQLPLLASYFCHAAETIYQRVMLEQFRDYEARYGEGVLAKINNARIAALIGAIKSYMLYAFFRYAEEVGSNPDRHHRLTRNLQKEMEQIAPQNIATPRTIPNYSDYVNYQNPHFEDARMAPAYRFGNDIGEIMEQCDRPFCFMASQQAMILAVMTKQLLGAGREPAPNEQEDVQTDDQPAEVTSVESTSIVGYRPEEMLLLAKYFGWWFAWGIFSGILVFIVVRGGALPFATQIFVIFGIGAISGTTALICAVRKRFPK